VLIVDTGIADDISVAATNKKNFVDPGNKAKVTDEDGHGTAIALIIREIIPEAELLFYKVVDASGRASEWDTIAALCAKHDANVVNISLAFGLRDKKGSWFCNQCGRESQSSRSQVFETVIDQFKHRSVQSIVVAGAGNDGRPELTFPARFGQVL